MMKIGGYSLRSGCLKWTFVGVTGLSCCLPVWKGEQVTRRGMKASSCWSKSSAAVAGGGGAKTAVDHRRTSSPEAPTSSDFDWATAVQARELRVSGCWVL